MAENKTLKILYAIFWLSAIAFLFLGFKQPGYALIVAVLFYMAGAWRDNLQVRHDKIKSFDNMREAQRELRRSKNRLKKARRILKSAEDCIHEANILGGIVNLRFGKDDLEMIKELQGCRIEKIVNATLVLPMHSKKETEEEYLERRAAAVHYRASKWVEANRYGNHLLPIVQRQYGLCGDLVQGQGKGCGCYLYCLPVSAVHLDHIQPQSLGGGDEPDNMQALCTACNLKAGNKIEADEDMPE
ncbi:HNH endonuclease [Candidatus Poribacteria bacterium]|nr:HNH endonuclease [Candidatus Poribacteria bacterium]